MSLHSDNCVVFLNVHVLGSRLLSPQDAKNRVNCDLPDVGQISDVHFPQILKIE